MDFKRALVRPQKGTSCRSVRRLLEAKRACVEIVETRKIMTFQEAL